MLKANEQKLLDILKPSDLVLDVGGWACPFNRANWIIDAQPYETRGFYRTLGMSPCQGGDKEYFTRETWVMHDICSHKPFPFRDKQFDFVICSHVLEDVRDPLWVCSELMRVAKKGYIEVPSRELESCRDYERPGMVGLSHHRWLIEVSPGYIRFFMKHHMIHCHWKYSFPLSHALLMPPEKTVQFLWWDQTFHVEESVIHGETEVARELELYVQAHHPYSPLRLALDWPRRWVVSNAWILRKTLFRPPLLARTGNRLLRILRAKTLVIQ